MRTLSILPIAAIFVVSSACAQSVADVNTMPLDHPALFADTKPSAGHMRDATASALCRNPQEAASFRRGISLVYVYELADKSDRIEYAIDGAACASL